MLYSERMNGSPARDLGEKYHPIFELGRGGMSTVYLAVHRGPGGFHKLQVVKKLRREMAEDPEFFRMFLEEARLAARINHPNVVQTNEVDFDGKDHFIAMEYLDGQSFEAFLKRTAELRRRFPIPLQLRIVADALEGLHFAHELQDFDGTHLHVVHRDMSPQNIFVTYEGQVKVVDFGIAKAADSSLETRTGVLKGKVAYMSPEQIGCEDLDRRADIFAVGAILWRVLTGRRLWRGLSDVEIMLQIGKGQIPSPKSVRKDLPDRLVDICMKALAMSPDDRYQTAAELQTDLEGYLDRARQRVSNREIGKLLSELFAGKRAEIARAIGARIRAPPSPASGEVPELSEVIGRMTGTPSMPQPLDLSLLSGRRPIIFSPPETNASSAKMRGRDGRYRDGIRVVFALVGILTLVSLAVYYYRGPTRRNADPVPPETAQTPVNPSSSAAATSTEPEYVELKVSLRPPDAVVFVDDQRLDSTKLIRDGRVHRVRAEAPGYAQRSQLVTFDSRVIDIGIVLDPVNGSGRWQPPTMRPSRVRVAPKAPTKDDTLPSVSSAEGFSSFPSPRTTSAPPPLPPSTDGTNKPALDMTDPWRK
jgi:serine/threonine protein kinase